MAESTSGPLPHLRDMTLAELRDFVKEKLGEPAFRGNQLFEWLYRHRAPSCPTLTARR